MSENNSWGSEKCPCPHILCRMNEKYVYLNNTYHGKTIDEYISFLKMYHKSDFIKREVLFKEHDEKTRKVISSLKSEIRQTNSEIRQKNKIIVCLLSSFVLIVIAFLNL